MIPKTAPSLSPTRRTTIPRTFLQRIRMMPLLLLGCALFIVLHRTFGGSRTIHPAHISKFPRKIWQSWKIDGFRFDDREAERASTWTAKPPKWRYKVLTDDNGETYVEEHYGPEGFNRPDIVMTYKALNARIVQADLLRWLIMFAEGGIWADIDVEALRSFGQFIPPRYEEVEIDMIIGTEADEPSFKDHPILGSKAQSFCQWTFACKPRLPVIMRLIEEILDWLHNLAVAQGTNISELELTFDQLLSGTGPSAFTRAILAEISAREGEAITWDNFHGLKESTLTGRFLVLPAEAFAATQATTAPGPQW